MEDERLSYMVNLRRINLNLLVMLDALLQTRSVTAAAERLGLTQPAVSTGLAKLRDLFADELLVVVGRVTWLTPRAEQLQTPLQDVLETIETMLDKEQFDPRTWDGNFVIATADYMSVILLPHLAQAISKAAPLATVRFTNISHDAAPTLKPGSIDMIIAPIPLVRDPILMSRRIFSDRWLCAFRADSRFATKPVTLDEYLARARCALIPSRPRVSAHQNPSGTKGATRPIRQPAPSSRRMTHSTWRATVSTGCKPRSPTQEQKPIRSRSSAAGRRAAMLSNGCSESSAIISATSSRLCATGPIQLFDGNPGKDTRPRECLYPTTPQ